MFQQEVVLEGADLAEVDESVPGRDLVRPPLAPAAHVHRELQSKILQNTELRGYRLIQLSFTSRVSP